MLTEQGKSHKNDKPIIIDGFSDHRLAEHLATYFKGRAESLVEDRQITNAPALNGCIEIDEIPENRLVLTNFPPITDITKTILNKKVTKSASMDTISSHLIILFWDSMKENMNTILTKNLEFPKLNQGYYQRIISKSSTITPTILKDMRPLGILNPLPKYLHSKFVWTAIREHVKQIYQQKRFYILWRPNMYCCNA